SLTPSPRVRSTLTPPAPSCSPLPSHLPPLSPLFPYTTLFRSAGEDSICKDPARERGGHPRGRRTRLAGRDPREARGGHLLEDLRSEEHTSELQSRVDLVCRLLLEKKKMQSST